MNKSTDMSLRFIILVTGASGIIAQLILIRELMVSFYGNELSIGLVLANWLILEALGSFLLGKTIERAKNKLGLFSILVIIFSVGLPIMIYLARIIKNIIGVAPGETLSIPTMFLTSFLILLPLSITHGALFTFSCNLFSTYQDSEKAVGKVYVLETVGTIIGGIILPYLLIPYFSSFDIGFGLSLINFIVLLFVILAINPTSRFKYSVGILIIIFGLGFIGKIPERTQNLSINQQWHNHNVVYYHNSIYGNITVIKEQEQYTFFEDGVPVINTPVPDIAFAEDFVHFSLLAHPDPKEVLVIGGAAGGILTEILKHPVAEVDYIELDPLLLKTVEKFPTPITTQELSDPRVRLIIQDARSYLRNNEKYYDVILVNHQSPATLQSNRLFTKEFFELARTRLKENGILANISFGSLSYLSQELKRIIESNIQTLKSVFPWVEVIPGDFNLYLASGSSANINPAILIERLKQRKIQTVLITEEYISDRLSEYRYNWFWGLVKSPDQLKNEINSDLAPRAVFYTLSYWNSLASASLKKFYESFQTISIYHFLLVFILLLIIGIILVNWQFKSVPAAKPQKITMPIVLFSTGFAGMILNLVIVLAFQSIYGYVYHQISILVTAFIVGTAIGGIVITRYAEKFAQRITIMLLIEMSLILMSIIIPLILLRIGATKGLTYGFIFPILSVMIGVMLGMEFPLANRIYTIRDESLKQPPVGWLYASDLAGGFFGAILISAVLIPVLGIFATCSVALMAKVASVLLISYSQLGNTKKLSNL